MRTLLCVLTFANMHTIRVTSQVNNKKYSLCSLKIELFYLKKELFKLSSNTNYVRGHLPTFKWFLKICNFIKYIVLLNVYVNYFLSMMYVANH